MELRCNIIDDHKIADVTPGAFCFARTLVIPDCPAADSQIADRGKGVMNAHRSSRGRWCNMAILIAFAAILAVCISPALASALTCDCDICVNTSGWWRDGGAFNASGTRIQAAVDNATAGETIYVYNGSYTENLNVNQRLTLRGEGADVVYVTNSTANNHVFEVTADYVNISGFNVSGAIGTDKAGIYLNGRQHCNISNNNASGNHYGIYLNSSSNNTIYNNHFNNTCNAWDNGNNTWNTTPIAGTNIIGGSWLGGNYWSDYTGADTTGDCPAQQQIGQQHDHNRRDR